MILKSNEIRLELTRLENIEKIIKIESENSEFIGLYDFERQKGVIESDDELHFSIFSNTDNSLIGHIILAGLTNPNASIEFRRIVIADKGKGYGKESIQLLLNYCFNDLKAHRIWLDVVSENKKAIGIYESQGFKIEGLLRECIWQNNQYKSINIMSILASEYDK